jgi:hypothetical protein
MYIGCKYVSDYLSNSGISDIKEDFVSKQMKVASLKFRNTINRSLPDGSG